MKFIESLPKVLWHIALGAVLLNMYLQFERRVSRVFGKTSAPKLTKPFQVSGRTEDAAKRGRSLAHLLNGRLAKIDRELVAATRSFGQAEETPSSMITVEGREPTVRQLNLSGGVLEPFDLKMTVGTVEVGGLWLDGWMAADSALANSLASTCDKSVAAADRDGKPAYFSNRDAETLWPPEVEIAGHSRTSFSPQSAPVPPLVSKQSIRTTDRGLP